MQLFIDIQYLTTAVWQQHRTCKCGLRNDYEMLFTNKRSIKGMV